VVSLVTEATPAAEFLDLAFLHPKIPTPTKQDRLRHKTQAQTEREAWSVCYSILPYLNSIYHHHNHHPYPRVSTFCFPFSSFFCVGKSAFVNFPFYFLFDLLPFFSPLSPLSLSLSLSPELYQLTVIPRCEYAPRSQVTPYPGPVSFCIWVFNSWSQPTLSYSLL
jgi:hypothetical protein